MDKDLEKEMDRDLLCFTITDDDFRNILKEPYSKEQLKVLLDSNEL